MKKIKLEILQVGKIFANKEGSIIPLSSKVMEFNEDLAKELIKANVAVVYNEKTESNSKKELELKRELQNAKEKGEEADKLIIQLQEENKKLEEELEKIKIEMKAINESAKVNKNEETK